MSDQNTNDTGAGHRFIFYTAVGSTLMLVGILALVTSAGTSDLRVLATGAGAALAPDRQLLVAALLLGSGHGFTLSSGLALTAKLAQPARRGALSAVFLGCAYVGFGMPYVTAVTAAATSIEVPLAVLTGLTVLLAARLVVATSRGQAA